MSTPSNSSFLSGALVALLVAGSATVAAIAVMRYDITGKRGSGLPESFEYDVSDLKQIDPALFQYRPVAEIAVPLKEARAVAVGPKDRIYVAGDKSLLVFEPSGEKVLEIALEDEPRALAIGYDEHAFPGRLYVAMQRHVEVLDTGGKRLASWEDLGKKAVLTSIALADRDVLVADAGNRIVYRYDPAGKLIRRIGKRDDFQNIPGFIVPSPYFDVAVSPDGLVRVANPGARRIEGFTLDGHLEVVWGKQSDAIEGFSGCCNPANFAILPDGSFVTAEKGELARVKVYSQEGAFAGVVAGPETLTHSPVVDVAADSRGRVLVLDPGAGKVRVYEPKEKKASEPR